VSVCLWAWSWSHVPFSISTPAVISSEWLKRKSTNFVPGRIYQVLAIDDNLTPTGRGQGRHPFSTICLNHVFGIGESRHFEFRVLIDAQEY